MCDERDQLVEYVYDEADPAGRARFEAHLASCDRCREELTEFRQVRTKLLAWDVPDHGSVWTPFVSARALPWYRQVPTWALAAAASLMLVIGGLGGFAAHSWLTSPKTVASVAPAAPVMQGVTVAEFSALEQRIVAIEQTQEKQQVAIARAVSAANVAVPSTPVNVVDEKTIEDLRKEQAAGLLSLHGEVMQVKGHSDAQIRWLRDQLRTVAATQQAQQPGGGF